MLVKKSFIALVALTLLLGAVAIPAAPVQAGECNQSYTVRAGDTLNSIAIAHGVTWPTLAKINKIPKPYTVYPGQTLCISTVATSQGGPGSGTGTGTNQGTGSGVYRGFPTFAITGVNRNTSVTVRTTNLPPNDTFTVRMGAFGTRGVGGIVVDTVGSSTGGSRTYTFNIPAALVGSSRIAIRMESPTSGYFAYNWFFNSNAGAGTGGGDDGTSTPGKGYSGIPTFSISSVARNGTVTIRGNNFPPNDSFTVRMGLMGTRGVGGFIVDTYNSGAGGNFTATFTIPSQLYNNRQIAIRLESPSSGYFAYNWFWNNNAP